MVTKRSHLPSDQPAGLRVSHDAAALEVEPVITAVTQCFTLQRCHQQCCAVQPLKWKSLPQTKQLAVTLHCMRVFTMSRRGGFPCLPCDGLATYRALLGLRPAQPHSVVQPGANVKHRKTSRVDVGPTAYIVEQHSICWIYMHTQTVPKCEDADTIPQDLSMHGKCPSPPSM